MVDKQEKKFFSAFVNLGRSVLRLIDAFKGSAITASFESMQQPGKPPALPAPAEHSEAAQLLTQHTPGWNIPIPSTLPVPSYAPATTAFGIVFIALGAVTKWPISIIGAIIFVLAIAKWIGELLHD